MADAPDVQRRRLYMRSIRRGIKEMDLILGAYARDCLGGMTPEQLTVYEVLLSKNDHDLYQWVTGQSLVAPEFSNLIEEISRHAHAA